MQLGDITSFFDRSFAQNIAASIVYALAIHAIDRSRVPIASRLKNVWLSGSILFLNLVFIAWMLGVVTLVYLKIDFRLYFVVGGIVNIFLIWNETAQFRSIGIYRADRTVAVGTSYEDALELVQNQFDFLGLGASKLTSSKNFEDTIRRCHRPDQPIRFLLSKPDNPVLEDAARQQGTSPDAFRTKVENSLRLLKELKEDHRFNIEVRFYPSHQHLPIFRLMFVNDAVCFVSYYVFGDGDGSQLPQLVLRRFNDRRDVGSFYHAFRIYFGKLWDDSMPWDFSWPIK